MLRTLLGPKPTPEQVDVEVVARVYLGKMSATDKTREPSLLLPYYVDWITSVSDVSELHGSNLPGVYVWNENPAIGSFTLSVNGYQVGKVLEEYMPRAHPQFAEVRDKIMDLMNKIALGMVQDICQKSGSLPSQVLQSIVRPW